MNQMTSEYKQSMVSQLLRIAGSIDILGNPWGFITHLGAGLYDIVDKPAEALLHGPYVAPLQVLNGGLSMLKHGTYATCNSFSMFT